MEAIYLFSDLILFNIIGIDIISYMERKYKKEHPEECN